MTVAPQGELTLRVNKLASWHLPVAAVTVPGELLVSSSTEGIAACDSIPWPGPTVLLQVGRIRDGRPFGEASRPALRRLRHGGRAEMPVHRTHRLYLSALSPSLWPL
jgi:hypothetical protein